MKIRNDCRLYVNYAGAWNDLIDLMTKGEFWRFNYGFTSPLGIAMNTWRKIDMELRLQMLSGQGVTEAKACQISELTRVMYQPANMLPYIHE